MLAAGARVGERFIVEGLVSEGGTAAVYRVRHTRLGTLYALKLLTPRSPLPTERLLREGRIQATLQHPCIVNVLDVVDVDGGYGLVMEYVDGPTLAAIGVTLPFSDTQLVFADILGAVASAHEIDILHRDLKPQNVLMAPVSGGWLPKVADFGIARLARDAAVSSTRIGFGMGTPGYVAPEQRRDAAAVDARADIYSLGVLYYEMLAGRLPFGHEHPADAVVPPILGVSDAVNEALRLMLAVDPAGRPASVAEVAALMFPGDPDLRDIAAGRLPPRPVAIDGVRRPQTDPGVSQTLLPDPNLTMLPHPPSEPSMAPARAESPPPSRWRGVLVGALVVAGVGLAGFGVARWGSGGSEVSGSEGAGSDVAGSVGTASGGSGAAGGGLAGGTAVLDGGTVAPGGAVPGDPAVAVAAGAVPAGAVPAGGVAGVPAGAVPGVAGPGVSGGASGSVGVPGAAEGGSGAGTVAAVGSDLPAGSGVPAVDVAATGGGVTASAVSAPSTGDGVVDAGGAASGEDGAAAPEAAAVVPTGAWVGSAGGRPFIIRLSGSGDALRADVTVTLGITDRTSRYVGRVGSDGRVVLTETDGTGRIEGRFSGSSGTGSLVVGKGKPLAWEVGRQ